MALPNQVRTPWRAALLCGVAFVCLTCVTPQGALAQQTAGIGSPQPTENGASGLPVPRFVSLKSDRVHARQGPGLDHKVLWVYQQAGLPLEVVREYEGWRQVRDSQGAESWIVQSLVSGRRTALVMPWDAGKEQTARIELRSGDREDASPVATIEAGVIANIRSCDKRWCYVSIGNYRGFVPQKRLWGVYPGEVIR